MSNITMFARERELDPAAIDTPEFLEPLVAAVRSGVAVMDAMGEAVRRLGFDTFLFGASTEPRLSRDSRKYGWSNVDPRWFALYDQHDYIEVDPRMIESETRSTPFLWDRFLFGGAPRAAEFYDAAARFGVCSGIVVPIRDPEFVRAGLALNSRQVRIDSAMRRHTSARLGDILLLANFIHANVVAHFLQDWTPAPTQGLPLSKRERECLLHAAKGNSSKEIAALLSIGHRTVDDYFASLLSKMGVQTRREAIAVAISKRLIEP